METGENNNTSFISHEINLQETENYHLSIDISPTRILLGLLKIDNLRYDLFKRLVPNTCNTHEIISCLNSEDILKQHYSTSTITYSNYPSVIVPNKLYDSKQKKQYINLIHDDIEIIKSENIHQIDATIIYSIPKKIDNIIKHIQPKIIERNNSNILIDQIINQYNTMNTSMFLFVNERYSIEIIILKEGRLLFQNQFVISSETDVLYYVLFAYEQLKLDTEKTEIHLFGDIVKDDDIYSVLHDYIREIKFGEISKNLMFADELKEISDHKYFGLFSQLLCV